MCYMRVTCVLHACDMWCRLKQQKAEARIKATQSFFQQQADEAKQVLMHACVHSHIRTRMRHASPAGV